MAREPLSETPATATVTAPARDAPLALKEAGPAPAPDAVPALPAALLERYASPALLGRGGMGVVYRATDLRLQREVALKFLLGDDGDVAERLLREARSQARLDHENACKVYEVGVAEGRRYLVMQYVDGAPLDQLAARMTLEEKVRAARQVALALHEAHRLGLVHRDVKPSNILVEQGEDGAYKPYLTDFGIAREAGAGGQTMTGAIAGTPAFMAPEQARGEVRALDRRTDVYSLGATLYAVLAGQPPFSAPSTWRLLARITTEDAPPIRAVCPAVPADLEAVLAKCLERDPARRYDSAKALAEDLGRFLDGDPVRARRLTAAHLLVRKARKHRALVAIAGAAILAAVIVAALWVRARRRAAEQAELSRALGEDVKEMELFLRSAYALPLHDVERERDLVRARLRDVEARMAAAGPAGEGPGHYALGRGHLALQEPEEALAHLRKASAAGYASPELDYALGLSLGELGTKAMEEAKRIADPARKAAREAAIKAEYEAPALRHLRGAVGARLETAAYAEGLIALYEGRPEEALTKAQEAFARMPWLHEAKRLEGDAHFALGSRFRHDAAFDLDKMMGHFTQAAEAYRRAAEIARSDPGTYLGQCELWAQIMNAATARAETLQSSFDQARAACRRAVEASPRSEAARAKLAFVQALFAWWIAAGVVPDDPGGVLADAIAQADEAARRSPRDPMASYVLGLAWRAKAYHLSTRGLDAGAAIDRSIAAYEQAVALDPTFLWAVNELASVYAIKAGAAIARGHDPLPFFEQSLAHDDQAIALDAGFFNARTAKIITYLLMAEHLAGAGRDPAAPLARAREAIEAAKALSHEWPTVDYYVAYAHWIEALHDLDAGRDPAPALARGAESAGELARRAPAALFTYEIVAKLGAARALHLLRRGEDPEPALRDAREALGRAVEARGWDVSFRIWQARVETLGLRWSARRRALGEAAFTAARAPLLPLLGEERADPDLYQVLAEIDAIEAAFRLERGKNVEEVVAAGLLRADRALASSPRLARALAARGELLLMRARAARDPGLRREAARGAGEALAAALKENPSLEGDHGAALGEVEAMQRRDGGGP